MNPVNSGPLRFGNFEVLSRPDGSPHLLGGGAFGKTYKARHLFLEQTVALKVINEQFLNDRSIKERFLREARVVHGLRHPHIAHVMDFGEVNGTLYYAMEFCAGGSLDDYVRTHGPQDAATVQRFARQLAEALGCAHGRGFIHRDIKPANVMLAEAGGSPVLKLVDFGLVKNLQPVEGDGTASLTLDGQHFFTILFASPEQLEERALDARSDLFSVGMTLWFLLKGSAPESGASATVVAKRLGTEPYRGQLPPSLPAGLRAVLGKLLEKSPEDRYQSAAELLAALDALESPPPAPVTTPPAEDADLTVAGAGLPVPSPSPPAATPVPPAAAPVAPPPLPPAPPMPSGPPPIEQEYLVLEGLGRGALGPFYRVRRRADGQTVALTLLSDTFQEDPARLADLRRDVDRLRGAPHEAVAQVFGFQEFAEGTVLAQEWATGGISLFQVLKARGSLAYADALRALRPTAEAADFLQALDVPGVALGAEEIFLAPEETGSGTSSSESAALLGTPLRAWPSFRVRVRPVLAREDAVPDAGATLGEGAMSGNARVEFAALVYQLVAGRRPSTAARMTRAAYTAVSGLGEESNRLLSACLCDEAGFDGCVGILHALSRSEGVNETAAGPRSGASSSGGHGSLGSGGATVRGPVLPPAMPPVTTARVGSTGLPASVPLPVAPPPPPVVLVPVTVPAVAAAPVVRAVAPPPTVAPPPLPARQPAAVGVPPIGPVVSHAPRPTVPPTPTPGRARKQWLTPLLILGIPALLLGLAAIVGAMLFLSPSPKPPPGPDPGTSGEATPGPTAVATVAATPTAAPTLPPPPPAPREFVLAGGVRPADAFFELNGRPVAPTRGEDGRLVIPLTAGGSSGGEPLRVSARGYEPRTLTVAAGGSLPATLELARQTVRVPIQAERNRSDYATAVFTMTEALPGEKSAVPVEVNMVSVELSSLPTAVELPTGIYRVNLLGAAGARGAEPTGAAVQPFALAGAFVVRAGEGAPVSLPPSFAGRYQQEFTFRPDPAKTVTVTRVLVIEPGLGGGHADDVYVTTENGRPPQTENLRNIPVSGLRLDERGVLRGLIRFTQMGPQDVSYDEQFEVSYSPQTRRLTIQGGGWEIPPDNPALAAQLKKKHGRDPYKDRPPPRSLARLE